MCDEAQAIIESQPILLECESPIIIFGDIHGQYKDLMRFFDLWATQNKDDNKQIEINNDYEYLFLGDYVDRGTHSLETICLLLALKIKMPKQVHLLRGNHEDKSINYCFGFADECRDRLGEDSELEDSVFNRINTLFEYLPLAAVIGMIFVVF